MKFNDLGNCVCFLIIKTSKNKKDMTEAISKRFLEKRHV